MLALQQDLLLEHGVLHLIIFYQYVFPDRLDGILLTSDGQLTQEHFTKSALTNQAHQLKVLILYVGECFIPIADQYRLTAVFEVFFGDAGCLEFCDGGVLLGYVLALGLMGLEDVVVDVATACQTLLFEILVKFLLSLDFSFV